MKTTLDIADNIAIESRRLSKRENVSFKDLVEEGLRLVIQKRAATPKHIVKPVTFKGNGMTGDFDSGTWGDVRVASTKAP
ncbi:MAG: hypothetical protein ACI9X0_002456 [Kiritimatiellia bacterium]|jgi:hypothetical protein